MNNIVYIDDQFEKQKICNDILRSLPDYFAIEAAIIEYVNNVASMPFWIYQDENKNPLAFIAIKKHNQYTAEIYVMAVVSSRHRQGIGKQLIDVVASYCSNNNIEFLTVRTLDESNSDPSYNKTRQFYFSVGFKPLEVFPLLWDKNNPCLFMVKALSKEK